MLWGRILWLIPSSATRDSYESDQFLAKPPEPSKGNKLKLSNVIKQRLQLAEHGRWDVLLKHYMADLALTNVPVRGANYQSDGDLTFIPPTTLVHSNELHTRWTGE